MAHALTPSRARVRLRPATAEDREFLFTVYATTRAEELAAVPWTDAERATFLRMQFEAQDSHYRQAYPDARFDIIERAGTPVGRLYVARLPDEIRIVDIALLPTHRGRGIGSALMEQLIGEADAQRLRITLHVEPWNPARRLYLRIGFRTVRPGEVYELMERPAS